MSDLTTEYSDFHIAVKDDSGQWDLDTLYDNSKYINFEWTDSNRIPYIDFEDIIIDVFKVDSSGLKTKIYVADDDDIDILGLGWDPDSGLFQVFYNITGDHSYEMWVYYQYSTPYKPARLKVSQDPQSAGGKQISVPPGAKFIIYNTPKPPPPPT